MNKKKDSIMAMLIILVFILLFVLLITMTKLGNEKQIIFVGKHLGSLYKSSESYELRCQSAKEKQDYYSIKILTEG